jgi:hypothetical protein
MSDIVIERESVEATADNESNNTKTKKPLTLTDLPEELLLYLVKFSLSQIDSWPFWFMHYIQ